MSDCVFCDILAGDAPATIVASWVDGIAIVPLNPVVPGHTLIVPRYHVVDALEDPATTAIMFGYAAEFARRPCNLITSAGTEATQTVMHLHLHVIPRRAGDGLSLPWTDQRPGP